jgi:nickel-dependent lactate racemase
MKEEIPMPVIQFPYGKETLSIDIPQERLSAVLTSEMHHYKPELSQEELVREALEHPIGTPKLSVMAEGKKKVVIIASDHTRPVPSKIIMPQMLAEIRKGNPDADITILISTGCHRETTKEELVNKFGPDIVAKEKIVIHDCDDPTQVSLGKLPSGGELIVDRLAVEADLLVAEGFIEPHFFAGFSGGRKSVLPGIASRKTVIYNHNAEFIASDRARTGIVDGNPIHIDMLYAARAAHLAFICNVVINSDKEVIYAVSGDVDQAHIAGREFLSSKCKVDSVMSDIVISTNGGYPLDQNIYQAVKGMTAAEATVKEGGVIIMLAKSNDGHGGAEFYKTFKEEKDLNRMMATFLATPKDQTRIDQWQSQIFARLLMRATVIYISDAPDDMVSDLHMVPAHSLEEAMKKAEEIVGNPNASVCAIPDGVSVIVI